MKATRVFLLAFALIFAIQATGQVSRIIIPAGTPEDKELQAISTESDLTKRLAMLDKFVVDYAGSKDAVAYGYWQMSQTYQTMGDNSKALAAGEKAAEMAPGNLDVLASLCGIAESTKDYKKIVDYAVKGGSAYNGIAQQPKPEGLTAEAWNDRIQQDMGSNKQMFDYLEAAALNALSAEPDPKLKLALVEKFQAGFPKSRFDLQVSHVAMAALQQLNDPEKSIEFGERALKTNPDSVPTLLMMANALVEDPKSLARATDYAAKAVKLSSKQVETPDGKLTAGIAKSTYGYALLKAEKLQVAIPELKESADLLAENPPVAAEALFRLGWAYGKLKRKAEAQEALQKCIAIEGPYQKLAKDLLEKVNATPTTRRK